jgi:hypothetical protein
VPIQSVFRNFNFWDSAGALEKLSIHNVRLLFSSGSSGNTIADVLVLLSANNFVSNTQSLHV